MEKTQKVVDFENQMFDELAINPYEIVIAVSKMAREINDKARKYLPPECDINATAIALNRIAKETKFSYGSEGEEVTPPEES